MGRVRFPSSRPITTSIMRTFLLLLGSNIFMTLAWYGQLKLKVFEGRSLWFVILLSWGIAFFEYCLMVPLTASATRRGSRATS